MKRYNITTVKSYEKNGEQKKFYPQVGTLVEFEANGERQAFKTLELNMFPDTKFFVFEEKPKEEVKKSLTPEDISVENIPF